MSQAVASASEGGRLVWHLGCNERGLEGAERSVEGQRRRRTKDRRRWAAVVLPCRVGALKGRHVVEYGRYSLSVSLAKPSLHRDVPRQRRPPSSRCRPKLLVSISTFLHQLRLASLDLSRPFSLALEPASHSRTLFGLTLLGHSESDPATYRPDLGPVQQGSGPERSSEPNFGDPTVCA